MKLEDIRAQLRKAPPPRPPQRRRPWRERGIYVYVRISKDWGPRKVADVAAKAFDDAGLVPLAELEYHRVASFSFFKFGKSVVKGRRIGVSHMYVFRVPKRYGVPKLR